MPKKGEKTLYSNTKSKMTCYLAALAKNLLRTAHLVATGPAKETDAANKTSFLSKTKPPSTLNKQSRTEQIKSDKVEKALEASVEEFRKSGKKDLFTYQNLSSKTSSLRLDSQVAGAKRLDKYLKRMLKELSPNEEAAHAQKTQTAHTI